MNERTAAGTGAPPSLTPDAGRPAIKTKTADSLWGFLFITPQLIGLLLFSLIPLVSSFVLSLMTWDGFGERKFIGFENFMMQFKDEEFRIALVNTLYYTVLTVPTGILLAMLVAIGLNRVRGKFCTGSSISCLTLRCPSPSPSSSCGCSTPISA
ncbi:hypothetical protein PACILC2_34350 [Paenibacillus cisolokensis]|uniref:ABC transmembrane type-1 domain-containing protein n=1 Tax=Paenibacillus cisolokensis TaxID=1658519 RepID=A0ABQ4N9G6_9BACL|nr:hypothetical protein PACILC2_34350 [Paenibacillus cisolokensis]